MALLAPFYKFYRNTRKGREIVKYFSDYMPDTKTNNKLSILQNVELDALQPTNQDLSEVTPYFPKTFNLASYVNTSETLKNLVNLNVDLSKIEKKPHIVDKILKLDFDKDMKDHIIFLSDYVGMENIGSFVTTNPMILCQPLDDLQVRVNYLQSKGFKDEQICRIITRNPFWLMLSTVRIDRRLGYYQKSLELQGNEVRYLATKQPKLITYNLQHVKCNLFVVKEEMGFEEKEVKELVLHKPKILMLNQRSLFERFNYIHNVMKISHRTVLSNAEVLFCRNFKIKQRHLFLEKLGRSQYNPTKENYVPIKALVEDTDIEFCKKMAKCSVSDFNLFLKTL